MKIRPFGDAAVTSTLRYGDESVSVAIEDVAPKRWMADVYEPDIVRAADRTHEMPGYGPAARKRVAR